MNRSLFPRRQSIPANGKIRKRLRAPWCPFPPLGWFSEDAGGDDIIDLPKSLKCTEFGRDLLRQELELKRRAASLIHPNTEGGRAF